METKPSLVDREKRKEEQEFSQNVFNRCKAGDKSPKTTEGGERKVKK